MNVNQVNLVGRVGKDPTVREHGGSKFANLTLATSEKYKDRNGEKVEKTEWHNVAITSDALAGIVQKYVKKGDLIYVSGKMRTRKYEKDGVDHYTTEVEVGFGGSLQMGPGRSDSSGGGGNSDDEKPSGAAKKPASRELDDEVPF